MANPNETLRNNKYRTTNDGLERFCVEYLTNPRYNVTFDASDYDIGQLGTEPQENSVDNTAVWTPYNCPCKPEIINVPLIPDPDSKIKPKIHNLIWTSEIPEEKESLESDFVRGGNYGVVPTYVCGAKKNDDFIPGRYISEPYSNVTTRGCQLPDKGFLLTSNYQLLKGRKSKWVKVKKGEVPENAFVGGHENGDPLYVCLAKTQGQESYNTYSIGKVNPKTGRCYFPINPCIRGGEQYPECSLLQYTDSFQYLVET